MQALCFAEKGHIGKMTEATPESLARHSRSRTVLFMHVPKSAGQSFGAALAASIGATTAFSGFDRSFFGDFDSFVDFDPRIRRTVYLTNQHENADAELAAAHMSLSSLRAHFPQGETITVVREPRSRLLSLWLYWRGMSDDDLAPWGVEWASRIQKSRLPLAQFLKEPAIACQTDNQVCRMLLWPDSRLPAASFIDVDQDEEVSRAAWAKLQGMDLAVVNEDPDLEKKVSAWLGASFRLGLLNKAAAVSVKQLTALDDEMTQEAKELLEARSRLDQGLWCRLAEATMSLASAQTEADRHLHQTIARHRDAHAGREPASPMPNPLSR